MSGELLKFRAEVRLAKMQLARRRDATCLQEFSLAAKRESVWCKRQADGVLIPYIANTGVGGTQWLGDGS